MIERKINGKTEIVSEKENESKTDRQTESEKGLKYASLYIDYILKRLLM